MSGALGSGLRSIVAVYLRKTVNANRSLMRNLVTVHIR
jgi:hypothetical protein